MWCFIKWPSAHGWFCFCPSCLKAITTFGALCLSKERNSKEPTVPKVSVFSKREHFTQRKSAWTCFLSQTTQLFFSSSDICAFTYVQFLSKYNFSPINKSYKLVHFWGFSDWVWAPTLKSLSRTEGSNPKHRHKVSLGVSVLGYIQEAIHSQAVGETS